MICLGCGTKHLSELDCPTCHERLKRCLALFAHWPMELSLTPVAVQAIERAVRALILTNYPESSPELDAELTNLCNIMRAYLQHVAKGGAYTHEPTDEELLS